MKNLKTKTNR